MRESTNSPGQYVLSGMHKGRIKHLLLVDPNGVVSSLHGHNTSDTNVIVVVSYININGTTKDQIKDHRSQT